MPKEQNAQKVVIDISKDVQRLIVILSGVVLLIVIAYIFKSNINEIISYGGIFTVATIIFNHISPYLKALFKKRRNK